jgi:glycosyltransferase involved in cell wall biosynthesis
MIKPKVSILMSVYNTELYLEDAIKAVLNETYTDFEFLICDDASTDKSFQIIEKFACRDKRIKVFRFKQNTGKLSKIHQFLADQAEGDYIIISYSDDLCMPYRLELLVEAAQKNPEAVLVYGNLHTRNSDLTKLLDVCGGPYDPFRLFLSNYILNGISLIKKFFFIKAGGYNTNISYAEDFELRLRLAFEGDFINVNKLVYIYRFHSGNYTTAKKNMKEEYAFKYVIFKQAEKNVKEALKNEKKLTYKIWVSLAFCSAYYYQNKNLDKAFKYRNLLYKFNEKIELKKKSKNKYLVIIPADSNSLHKFWQKKGRKFDLCVVNYGGQKLGKEFWQDYYVESMGTKWQLLASILFENDFWRDYKYIWLPDDDLLTKTSDINELFDFVDKNKISLAQPALSKDSFYSHEITLQENNCFFRRTNFVEIMCPVFSVEALEICLVTFFENKSGWGLDFLWPKLLKNKICGIVDKIAVKHTKQPGNLSDPNSFYRKMNINPEEEMTLLLKKYGLKVVRNIISYYSEVDINKILIGQQAGIPLEQWIKKVGEYSRVSRLLINSPYVNFFRIVEKKPSLLEDENFLRKTEYYKMACVCLRHTGHWFEAEKKEQIITIMKNFYEMYKSIKKGAEYRGDRAYGHSEE